MQSEKYYDDKSEEYLQHLADRDASGIDANIAAANVLRVVYEEEDRIGIRELARRLGKGHSRAALYRRLRVVQLWGEDELKEFVTPTDGSRPVAWAVLEVLASIQDDAARAGALGRARKDGLSWRAAHALLPQAKAKPGAKTEPQPFDPIDAAGELLDAMNALKAKVQREGLAQGEIVIVFKVLRAAHEIVLVAEALVKGATAPAAGAAPIQQ